jgi:hypothetical protein
MPAMRRVLEIFGVLIGYAIFAVIVLALVGPDQLSGFLPVILLLFAGLLLIPISRSVQNQRMERIFNEMLEKKGPALNSIEFAAYCGMRLPQVHRFLDKKMEELGGTKEKDAAWGVETKGGYDYHFDSKDIQTN